jgi:hypothetical protein
MKRIFRNENPEGSIDEGEGKRRGRPTLKSGGHIEIGDMGSQQHTA